MQLEGLCPVTFPSSIPLSAFLRAETAYVPWFWAMLAAIQLATRRVSATQSSRTSHRTSAASIAMRSLRACNHTETFLGSFIACSTLTLHIPRLSLYSKHHALKYWSHERYGARCTSRTKWSEHELTTMLLYKVYCERRPTLSRALFSAPAMAGVG